MKKKSNSLSDHAEELAQALERRRFDAVRGDADALMEAEGVSLAGADLDGLLFELLRTRVVAMKRAIGEREADDKFLPREPLAAQPERALVGATNGAKTEGKRLGEAVALYIEEREQSGAWTSKRAAKDRKRELKLLAAALGDETPINAITAEQILKARSGLSEGRKPGTVRKIVGNWIALLNFAEKMGWIARNPARHLRPKEQRARDQRQPFSDADLGALFGPKLKAESLERGRPERWWVSLLALYTGARIEELAQLEVWDVREVDGIPCLEITDRALAPDGKTDKSPLKNDSSPRTTPLHTHLAKLGFLEYVAEGERQGHRRLFPMLKRGKDRGYGHHISRWFSDYRKRVGVDSADKTFHSFRHTFQDGLKNADVPEHTMRELMGHSDPSITTGRYGKKLELPKLRDAIELLDYRDALGEILGESWT